MIHSRCISSSVVAAGVSGLVRGSATMRGEQGWMRKAWKKAWRSDTPNLDNERDQAMPNLIRQTKDSNIKDYTVARDNLKDRTQNTITKKSQQKQYSISCCETTQGCQHTKRRLAITNKAVTATRGRERVVPILLGMKTKIQKNWRRESTALISRKQQNRVTCE